MVAEFGHAWLQMGTMLRVVLHASSRAYGGLH
jgi:hypothetical protein